MLQKILEFKILLINRNSIGMEIKKFEISKVPILKC